jgi:hypothetical protein
MSWKPSDKFIQVTAGLLLLTVSAFFLWRNTLRPISAGLRKEGVLSTNLKEGLHYLTGQGPEEVQNKEKEKLRLEEQALQEKLDQLRKKRESLQPVLPPTAPLPGAPLPAPESAPHSDTEK